MKVTRDDIRFGKKMKKLRHDLGLTQEQLAEKSNVSTTYIGLLETGRRKPSIKMLQKIARVLGVKASDLLPY